MVHTLEVPPPPPTQEIFKPDEIVAGAKQMYARTAQSLPKPTTVAIPAPSAAPPGTGDVEAATQLRIPQQPPREQRRRWEPEGISRRDFIFGCILSGLIAQGKPAEDSVEVAMAQVGPALQRLRG
jgi:hypothetical protein